MIDALHHVAIICADYDRSKDFYTRILGLPIIRETYRAERRSWKCDLAVGHAQIELFSFPDPPPRPSRPEARGLRHLAFAVRDLHAAVEHLQQAGIVVEPIRTDALTGRDFTFFADPDDLPLELYEVDPAGPPPGTMAT
ncbi:Glyoxalase/bleomycin resistance protein/dioxygenase [Gluconacetobacter diazotrophicus PA1 5]|uniref:VOC family protein n=2 Tax=Gluconacetobacter diazotrophicus TaxID=33996 RepID=A0A7W4I921_GLUDI|nr:VOC family protein [Gluconacetobacter diazotrophicus]ACI50458.1 Glyoxalase/bleomycin resistance protein/dioxygenase [Gluconacetobacter diazotrophicus PA1 5]MBB2158437.1 VOC family protein [Gluconacetobacter diazotrophicus]TWA98312.1 glyoxylase I family protein [Gluconacetobacter diazotrophicus]CAP56359.1 putative glyoxylase I family protein [Gluconacetobacter diazotrophicus PA1 5]